MTATGRHSGRPVSVDFGPHEPCGLARHNVGRRVMFHQWSTDARRMVRIIGTVVGHAERSITIRTDDGLEVSTECGHVTQARR